jgi:hypothetical protein
MLRNNTTSIVALLVAGLQISACSDADTPTKIQPATIEHIEGTDLSRVILTPKAAERLGIETAAVREVAVTRKRTPGGEVVPSPAEKVADIGAVWVRVPLNDSDLQKVDRSQSALVLAGGDDPDAPLMATPVEAPAPGEAAKQTTGALYYVIESAGRELAPGQRVRVETPLSGSGTLRNVVPYSAVIYGAHGESWVYTSPEPLTYVRHPISIDYVEDQLAVLSDGPPAGTEVVTVGVAELFGAEFEVGH